MPQAKIGVIGGTGLYDIEGLTDIQEVDVETPFGKPSDTIITAKLENTGIAFLPRHGRGHRISPTELPSRANIYALKSLGVEHIIAVNSCGSFKEELKPGELVIRQSKRGPFLGCNRFPRCRTIVSIKELDHLKELQAAGQWPPESREKADELLGRTKKKKAKATVASNK